jgi:uncharacterized protein (DUF2062 family)
MQRRSLLNKINRLAKLAYLKVLRIKDAPLRISLGFGLGVFVGVMPGIGPVIAVLLAFIFKVNRVSAFLGSMLCNTWVTFTVLILAIKIGSAVKGLDYHDVYMKFTDLIKHFKWEKLFDVSMQDVLIPIGIGFLIVSFIFAVAATLVVHIILLRIKSKKTYR